jgi:hypothetical protein
MKIESYYPSTENQFFYVTTDYGIMCSFRRDFEDIWFVNNLDDEEPIDGPAEEIVEELILEAQASDLLS